MKPAIALCPCGLGAYEQCCAPYHQGLAAPNAEALMRSRYSAYVLKQEDYVLSTWHPDTRPTSLDLATDEAKWLGLTVKQHRAQDAEHASVEFVARYKIAGRAHRLHEVSRFVKLAGKWLYLDGEFPRLTP